MGNDMLLQRKIQRSYKESHHPRYTKLRKVEDDQILTIGKDDAKRAAAEFADLNREDSSARSLVENTQ